jgi:tRNA U34 5-carboxymethylaminomethyl modifying GTPase MnmE/TrmE
VDLVDTAGRRWTPDGLERTAIETGRRRSLASHASVLVLDGSKPPDREVFENFASSDRPTWVLANKSDLGFQWSASVVDGMDDRFGAKVLFVSALTGDGCDVLRTHILEHFGLADALSPGLSLFTPRQRVLAGQLVSDPTAAKIIRKDMLGAAAGVGTG